ncbi:11073_t:CDS:1 [Ambispora gerdemannii]|uniref:glucan endo-1,3-beta-D-glucosidase n=1 Tax=Ambispora gerdemannii TaxID=144530 RepID=A0A9N8UXU7_9GLOM|nr:11073_t:CDS:1 [Ambispora gerdemannii]
MMGGNRETMFWRRMSKAAKDPDHSDWLDKQQKKQRRQRLILLTIGLILVAIIVGAIGYYYTHRTPPKYPNVNNAPTGNAAVNTTAPGDTKIIPDSRYSRSFYGIGYTPLNTQFPWCGASLANITEDIKILSQLTPRIRLYGQDCRQAEMVLQAIKLLNVKMSVILTVWVDANETTFQRQYSSMLDTLKTYGSDGNIEAVAIGNEVLFRKEIEPQVLFQRMMDFRATLQTMNLSKIKVITSDLGSNISPAMIKATDVVFANVHPFFAGVVVEKGADWTFTYFNETDVKPALPKPAVISEVGWPTKNGTNRGAVASEQNLQIFVDNFVCEANRRQVPYYFFEAFDEPWKIITGSDMETHWGIMTVDRELKIKIPNCVVPPVRY